MCAYKSNANSLYPDIAHAYWNEICDIEPLSAEEQKRLILLIRSGDKVAYDLLVESCLRLVVSRAKKYCHDFDSFMDLVQAGNIGLLIAVEHFDPDIGCSFSTYATIWIDKYIRSESCRTGNPIRVPETMRQDINQLLVIQKLFVQDNQREPSTEELAQIMHTSIEKIVELQSVLKPTLSLNQEDKDLSDSLPLIKKLADPQSLSPEDVFIAKETKKYLLDFMEQNLSQIEFIVLKLRFGFSDNQEPETLSSISAKCGITKEGVRKAEKRAIKKLHAALVKSGLTQVDLI